MAANFDIEKFACELNEKRFKQRMAWKDVAEVAGISNATMSRVCRRYRPDVDTAAKLIVWLEKPFERFISLGDK